VDDEDAGPCRIGNAQRFLLKVLCSKRRVAIGAIRERRRIFVDAIANAARRQIAVVRRIDQRVRSGFPVRQPGASPVFMLTCKPLLPQFRVSRSPGRRRMSTR